MTPEILSVREAGELLGVGETKAHELANRGIIPTFVSPLHRGRRVLRADIVTLAERLARGEVVVPGLTASTATLTTTGSKTRRRSAKCIKRLA